MSEMPPCPWCRVPLKRGPKPTTVLADESPAHAPDYIEEIDDGGIVQFTVCRCGERWPHHE